MNNGACALEESVEVGDNISLAEGLWNSQQGSCRFPASWPGRADYVGLGRQKRPRPKMRARAGEWRGLAVLAYFAYSSNEYTE